MVWTISFLLFLRIFISSCQCLYCAQCLPKVMIDGRCSRCKIGNVSVQAIDKDLSPGAKILFKPLMQHNMKSLEVKERFKQRQLNRTYVSQGMYRECCNSEKKKLEQIFVVVFDWLCKKYAALFLSGLELTPQDLHQTQRYMSPLLKTGCPQLHSPLGLYSPPALGCTLAAAPSEKSWSWDWRRGGRCWWSTWDLMTSYHQSSTASW